MLITLSTVMIVLYLACSYLLGAIPFGLIVARLFHGVDLRRTGSGNIGATNVARTVGTRLGVFTLFLDMAKGLVPVWVARYFFGMMADPGVWLPAEWIPGAAGAAAFMGHCYSPFLSFRGGKGVSTALGAVLGLAPLAVLPAGLVFVMVVKRWGYVSAGSMSGAAVLPPTAFLLGYPPEAYLPFVLIAVVIFIRHRENIGRLWRGEEHPWRGSQAQ